MVGRPFDSWSMQNIQISLFMLKELLRYQTHKCNKEKYICPSRIFNGQFSREIIADPSSDFSRALPGGHSIVWSVSELHYLETKDIW